MIRPVFCGLLLPALLCADTFTPYTAETVPQTVETLWADVDPRAESLEIEVIREWQEEGVTLRYLRYTVCTHEGVPSRVAALYCFPTGMQRGPAFVWAHGGGQRADMQRGLYFARQGYATVDINWGGREVLEGESENTDWGRLDPSQGPQFYPGALRPSTKLNLEPDEHTIDPVVSPRNGNWFLLALAGRRAITLLEQQPEVDPERIGFCGYSMGGNITSYCAIDPRLKAVAPMVGGTGFKMEDFPGLPGSSLIRQYRHPELYSATMDSEAYWPLVQCPVLFLNATNDFHGLIDRSYRCVNLLPHDDWQASYNLHYNHSLLRDQYAALNEFFDYHLKGVGKGLPRSVKPQFEVRETSARFRVEPDRAEDLVSVEVLYSHDPNPRVRFWKTAAHFDAGDEFEVELPVRENLPLWAFAHLTYRLDEPVEAFTDVAPRTEVITLTSDMAHWMPGQVDVARLRESAQPDPVFHDFDEEGITGWGTSARRTGLRSYKFQDPDWVEPVPGATMVVKLNPGERLLVLRLRLNRNEWLFNDEPKETYAVSVPLKKGQEEVRIEVGDFKGEADRELSVWTNLTSISLDLVDRASRSNVDLTQPEHLQLLRSISFE